MYEFLKFDNKSRLIRILSLPYQHTVHDVCGRKINCSASIGNCELCDLCHNHELIQLTQILRWFLAVYDYHYKKIMIITIGYNLFKQIKLLATDVDWGDPTQYDIELSLSKIITNKMMYVTPKAKTQFAYPDIANNVDTEYLKSLCQPGNIIETQRLAKTFKVWG